MKASIRLIDSPLRPRISLVVDCLSARPVFRISWNVQLNFVTLFSIQEANAEDVYSVRSSRLLFPN